MEPTQVIFPSSNPDDFIKRKRLECIYDKYSAKDYWGYKEDRSGRTPEELKTKERDMYWYYVNQIDCFIKAKAVNELKARLRYNQPLSLEIYETLTGIKLKGKNSKQLIEYFEAKYSPALQTT